MTYQRTAMRSPAGLPERAATRKRRMKQYERLDGPIGQRRTDYTTGVALESIRKVARTDERPIR